MRSKMFIRKKITKGLAAAGLFLCLFLTAVPVHAEEPATAASQTETAAEGKEGFSQALFRFNPVFHKIPFSQILPDLNRSCLSPSL